MSVSNTDAANRVAKIIFEAEDRTAAGVAKAKASVDGVGKSAGKATKNIGDAGAVAKGAGASIGQAFKRAAARIEQSSAGTKSFTDGMKKLGGAIKGAFVPATAAVAAFTAAITFADKIATESFAAERATARLQVSIEGASEAFQGYVSDQKLAQIANKGFALGVIANGKDLEKLARGVSAISEDLGGDQTELLQDAITGIGRKSTAILDNLGIILTQSEAEEEYAASLGKTVEQLSAYERSQAFTKIAIERVASAARDGAKANDSYAESWQKGKVKMQNWVESGYGFDAIGGRIRETVRELDEEVLELFGSRDLLDIQKINAALHESGLTYEQIKDYLIDINNIETMRGGQMDRTQRIQLQKALNVLAGEGLKHQEKQIKAAERAAALAEREAKAKADAEAIAALDHEVAVLQAIGASEKEILAAQEAALQLRIEQAEAAGDLAAQVEAERKLELLLLAAFAKKNKARGRGVTLAEKERAIGEAVLRSYDLETQRIRTLAELRGTEAESAYELAERERESKLRALDLEERVLGMTRAKNAVERTRNEARLEEIAAEREILALEAQAAAQTEVNRLIREAVALSAERAQHDANAVQREHELAAMRLDDEQARINQAADLEQLQARSAMERFEIERDREVELARLQRRRLEDEREAAEEALDAREAALRAEVGGDPLEQERREEEFRQLAHDREVARLDYEMQVRRSMEAEKAAMLNAESERFAIQMQSLEDGLSQFNDFRSEVQGLAQFFMDRSAEAADADLERSVASLQAKGQAQKQAIQREIDAAKGNVTLQNELRRKQARQDEALQKQVALMQARHQDKVKRQQMRAAGGEMAIVAVTEGIKALAAAASFNVPQALLHGAAATAASVKAAMLLSGKIPGGGAVASLNAGGGAGMSAGQSSQEHVDPSNVPGSVPGQAARTEPANLRERPAEAGTTVIINGGVNAWGSIDSGVAEDLARRIDKVRYSREN